MKIGESISIICVEDTNQNTKHCDDCIFKGAWYSCKVPSSISDTCHRCSRPDGKNVHFEISNVQSHENEFIEKRDVPHTEMMDASFFIG